MCSINNKKFQLRKVHSTYSLPERLHQSSWNSCRDDTKCNSTTSNQSSSLKSSGSSKSCKEPISFITKYKDNCKSMNSQPLSLVKVQFSNVFLDLIVDRIKLPDWIVILKTISKDKSLHFISLRSKVKGHVIQEHINTEKKAQQANKESVLYTRYLINKISESLGECLTFSKNFLCLQLHRIPLNGKGIQIIGEGLKKTQSLQHLSLQYCDVGDDGCLVLSHALRNAPTLITMDLSFCKISALGAKHIADLIKFQEIARLGECWKQSLRYREVDHDQIQGLRRITLNDNPDIGDAGLQYITDVLMDDFWVRALDMQNCGITEDGATLVKRLIEINNEIGVIDLRRNPQLNSATVTCIIKTLSKKITEEKAEYVWLHLMNNHVDNLIPPGSALNNVSNCGIHPGWNSKSSGRENKINSKSSALSSCSATAQISINKVEKWKKMQNITSDSISKRNSSNLNSSKSDFLIRDDVNDKEEKEEECNELVGKNKRHLNDTVSCQSIPAMQSEICSELKSNENEKINELTKNIKDIFFDFIKLSSAKNGKFKFEQYPNVNYQARKLDSDSDSDTI